MFVTEFVEKVREMRMAQNAYFKNGRKQSDLFQAKDLEKIVDKALAEGVTLYATPEPTQEEQLALFTRLGQLTQDEYADELAGMEAAARLADGDVLDTSAE